MIPRIQPGTLEFHRLGRLYAAVADGHPVLGAFPTLGSLLAALAGRGQADPGTRRRLLCAVIAAHQAAPGPLGGAIVLHAFRGMLIGLSRSLVGAGDADEADARVMAGLLEALPRVRAGHDPDRIGMYVRQETRRAVFRALRRDSRNDECFEIEEESAFADDAGDEGAIGDDAGGTEPEDSMGDEACSDEPMRDPLALDRASRRRDADADADAESLTPLEDRMFFAAPTVEGIPEETLRRAHALRGGLRRLTEHLFEDATPAERRRLYRQVVQRAERLARRS